MRWEWIRRVLRLHEEGPIDEAAFAIDAAATHMTDAEWAEVGPKVGWGGEVAL